MTDDGGRGPLGFDDATELHIRHRAKVEIRKRMSSVRRAVPPEARMERARRIADRVRALSAWGPARVIAGYVPMRGEVDVGPLLDAARAEGRAVLLPRVEWESETMTLHRLEPGVALEESGMGFLQPPEGAETVPPEEVDLLLAPALAADEHGWRIGWGKGFYDRLLPLARRATSVAVVFDFQLIAEVPHTPGDVRVDWVVTDARALRAHRVHG